MPVDFIPMDLMDAFEVTSRGNQHALTVVSMLINLDPFFSLNHRGVKRNIYLSHYVLCLPPVDKYADTLVLT